MDVGGRVGRLRERFEEAGVDALLVTNLVNVRYLTGFTGSAALLLVGPDDLLFVTDGRYGEQSAEQLGVAEVEARIEVQTGTGQREVVKEAGAKFPRIGVEADDVTWAQYEAYAEKWFDGAEPSRHGRVVGVKGLVADLRRVKDAGEQARIAAACRVSEHDFALDLEFEMRRRGAEAVSFEAIVASGPNGAKPHARPSERAIRAGELVVLDFGCKVDGYCSDMTRTVAVGEPAPEARRMYDVVLASQEAGVAATRAGVEAAEVDRACREVIEEAGWGDAFLHGTGHGVGLEIHEDPRVASTSGDTLATGHVVTVEPGVYLAGQGGVRIEDTVVVTEGGCEVLTHAPKDLILE
ncbi:MAG: aminopeptidase P family protein [Actinobacteria bacterium]|nr:aminopeptidase P family protein [Actinomycetota bacterium]